MKEINESTSVSITAIDKRTGKEELLYERDGSRCFFFEPIRYGDNTIQLRLDPEKGYKMLRNGEYPMLDADIYRNGKRIENGEWHHTNYEEDGEGNRLYNFRYEDLELILIVRFRIQVKLQSTMHITDRCEIEVRRNDGTVERYEGHD